MRGPYQQITIIIPAVVEHLHSECLEQFVLKDAGAAFLLPNCTYTQINTAVTVVLG